MFFQRHSQILFFGVFLLSCGGVQESTEAPETELEILEEDSVEVLPETRPEPLVETPEPAAVSLTPTKTSCLSVAHIGDSTSTGMEKSSLVRDSGDRLGSQLRRVGVQDIRLEAFGGRSMVEHRSDHENGVMVAKRLRASGFSGCWIVALGTNDTANVAAGSPISRTTRIERMMAVIGDDPVLWVDTVTITNRGHWAAENMKEWNETLESVLPVYPNAQVYRWSQDIHKGWFVKDGIHYNGAGYAARAKHTSDALVAAFPSSEDI